MVCVFIRYIGTYNDCVLSLSPNYLSDTYSANKYFARADVSHCCMLIKKWIFLDFVLLFRLGVNLI